MSFWLTFTPRWSGLKSHIFMSLLLPRQALPLSLRLSGFIGCHESRAADSEHCCHSTPIVGQPSSYLANANVCIFGDFSSVISVEMNAKYVTLRIIKSPPVTRLLRSLLEKNEVWQIPTGAPLYWAVNMLCFSANVCENSNKYILALRLSDSTFLTNI